MSAFEVHVLEGGDPGPSGLAAITAAIERTLGARSVAQVVPEPAWRRAARIEATGSMRVRARWQLSGR